MTDRVEIYVKQFCGKLRVRINNPNYLMEANCQFPRHLRVEGAKWTVPSTSIRLSQTKGKHFYRISTYDLQKVPSFTVVFVEPECVVCLGEKDYIYSPCCHFVCCKECTEKIRESTNTCPMCRSNIDSIVDKKNLL
jgi:hypothetical protein